MRLVKPQDQEKGRMLVVFEGLRQKRKEMVTQGNKNSQKADASLAFISSYLSMNALKGDRNLAFCRVTCGMYHSGIIECLL